MLCITALLPNDKRQHLIDGIGIIPNVKASTHPSEQFGTTVLNDY